MLQLVLQSIVLNVSAHCLEQVTNANITTNMVHVDEDKQGPRFWKKTAVHLWTGQHQTCLTKESKCGHYIRLKARMPFAYLSVCGGGGCALNPIGNALVLIQQ